MTIRELEAILATIKDKDMEVVTGTYHEEIRGYYIDDYNNACTVVLTRLRVQPSE